MAISKKEEEEEYEEETFLYNARGQYNTTTGMERTKLHFKFQVVFGVDIVWSCWPL